LLIEETWEPKVFKLLNISVGIRIGNERPNKLYPLIEIAYKETKAFEARVRVTIP
jgi:hypothetical protein